MGVGRCGGTSTWSSPEGDRQLLNFLLFCCAYLFANQHGNRIKVLVHDGLGIWLVARRLHQGKFVWAAKDSANCQLESVQLDALVLGLSWARIGSAGSITMV